MRYYVVSFLSLMCQMYITFLYCQGKNKNKWGKGWQPSFVAKLNIEGNGNIYYF